MANGIDSTDEQGFAPLPGEDDEEELIDPTVIELLATNYSSLPHDEAIANLANDYKRLKWEDQEAAARGYAEATDRIHQFHKITPESGIKESFAETLQFALDERIPEQERLDRIDYDAEAAIATRFSNLEDTEGLSSAMQYQREVEALQLYLKRGIISKDTGRMTDMIARAADAALSPLAGTFDSAFNTDARQSLQEYTTEITRPDLDDSWLSMGASYAGTIGGFAASAAVPGGPAMYLGASLINQSKEVYDTVMADTNDPDAAESAMYESVPWNVAGVLGDKFVGGMFSNVGKLVKGRGLSAATGISTSVLSKQGLAAGAKRGAQGAVAESVTEMAQEYGVGKILTKYTDNPMYTPTEKELIKIGLVAGAVGGGMGAAGGIAENSIKNGQQLAEAIANDTPITVNGETIASPQEFVNDILLKEANFQILEQRSKETGIPLEELLEQQGADEVGPGIFQSVYSKLESDIKDSMSSTEFVSEGVATFETEAVDEGVKNTDGSTIKNVKKKTSEVKDFGQAWKIDKDNVASMVIATAILKDLGTELAARFVLPRGALANAGIGLNPDLSLSGNNSLGMLKKLFRNPKAVTQIFFHEFAHRISQTAAIEDGIITEPVTDAVWDKNTRGPTFSKYVRVYKDFKKLGLAADAAAFKTEVDALDQAYVPYQKVYDAEVDPKGAARTEYRELGEEQFANSMSAILTNPEMVKANYPNVWRAFKKAVDVHPKLKQLIEKSERARTDPTIISDVYSELKKEGQVAETNIVKEAAKKKLDERQQQRRAMTKEGLKSFKRSFLTRFSWADYSLKEAVKAGALTKEEAHKKRFMLQATGTAHLDMDRLVDRPINNTLKELASSVKDEPELAMRNLANFMDVLHIMNDTNATIDEIKQYPLPYKRAVSILGDFLNIPRWAQEVEGLSGEKLVKKLSSLQAELTPEARALARKEMVKLKEDFAVKFLEEDAFNVRRFMANYAADYDSLNTLLEGAKIKVGYDPIAVANGVKGAEGDWAHYDKAITDIHKIGERAITAMDEAGLLNPGNRDKLRRNVKTYTPQNVIKYFEKDPRMPASLKKAYGSLDMTGNAITSYIGKMKATIMWSAFQQTQNNAVSIANDYGTLMREIKPKKTIYKKKEQTIVRYESIFDRRTLLQKKNPDKSYFITAREGEFKLMEVDDPDVAKMFDEDKLVRNLPFGPKITALTDSLNKLLIAHWTKTLGSASFAFGSKFYDIRREATVAGSKELNLTHMFFYPRHMSSELHGARKELRASVKKYRQTGEVDPYLQRFFDYGGSTDSLTREYGGTTDKSTAEHQVYSFMGEDIPGLEDQSLPDKWNQAAINAIRKVPLVKRVEEMAQIDEMTTKLMGFWIAENRLDKGPQEAAHMARNWFGTPDPSNSGTEMQDINKLFIFSRASVNGSRAMVELAKDSPYEFGFQYMYRTLMPRLMVSGAFMGPIVGALFGDDEEEAYRKFCSKLPSYVKEGKQVMGLGFLDGDSKFRPWGDWGSAKEIDSSWKSAAIAIPMDRGLVTANQLVTPLFNTLEDLLDTGGISGRRIVEDVQGAFSQVAGASMSPGLQALRHVNPLQDNTIWRGNPQDYFRKRGILSKDVVAAGDMYKKFAEYTQWSLYQTYPAMFGFMKPEHKKVSEPTSPYQMLKKFPVLGAVLGRFSIASNYGDIEATKEDQAIRAKLNSTLKLSMGEDTQAVAKEAGGYSALMSGMGRAGKKWKDEVDPVTRRKIKLFNQWRADYYTPGLQDMRDAHLMGDTRRVAEIRDRLERNSTRFLKRLKR